MINFFIGGARSGKSRRALAEAKHGVFIATAEAVDDEFRTRISLHQNERGPEWRTVECPLEVSAEILKFDDTTLVIDCLTVWLGNLMHYERSVEVEISRLLKAIKQSKANLFLVSNEVGLGVVPEHPMGREFRDWQGRLNQEVAAISDRVELLVAGIPLKIKP